jgi:hypothetical protein
MQIRRLPLLVLAVGVSLLLAACGGSTSASPSSTSTTNGASTANGSQSNLSACLKAKGITLPAGFGAGRGGPSGASGGTPGSRPAGATPRTLPAGVNRQQFQQALQACGGGNGFGRGGGANTQAFTAYLSCLSDHGVTVPTSTSGTQARGAGALSAVRSDPKFATANKTCQALLPTAGSTTTTTG